MRLTAKGLLRRFGGLTAALAVFALVVSAQTKKVGLTLEGGGDGYESNGSFADLFKPQIVTLVHSTGSALPRSFTLTPYFDQSGSLRLALSDVIDDSLTPVTPVAWRVMNAILDDRGDVSVSLGNKNNDVLLLSGIFGTGNAASGIWRSTTVLSGELHGKWFSRPSEPVKPIGYPEYSWWTFLLDPGDGAEPETVALQFQPVSSTANVYHSRKDSIPAPFQQVGVFPAGWTADHFQLKPTGMEMRLISPAGQAYCLRNGSFSGALDHLVCHGTWQLAGGLECNQSHGEGAAFPATSRHNRPSYIQIHDPFQQNGPTGSADGTWTGTSGVP